MHLQTVILLLTTLVAPHLLSAQKVGVVNSHNIAQSQIEHRVAIEHAYGGTMTRESALVSIITDLLAREVAHALGIFPDSSTLASFSDHADRNSKAPEILAAVKQIFGTDTMGYRMEYLAPRLVNIHLHSYFTRDTTLHATRRRAIESAYGIAASRGDMKAAAVQTGLRYVPDTVIHHHASIPSELARYITHDTGGQDPYVDLVSRMRPGELLSTIVETDQDYRVLRLRERIDSVAIVETIIADKGEYDEWFRRMASSIEIRITDPQLRREIARMYPNVWWVEKLATR